MNTMTHEGYIAEIELDEEAGLLSGVVLNTQATLHFTARTVKELRKAFAATIADYKAWCAREGREPERPFSGKLSLRISPGLHRRIASRAAARGESLNSLITNALEQAAGQESPLPPSRRAR